MRKLILLGAIAALAACAQADQDQYKCLGNQPVYGETNGVCYDATNDYMSTFVNDVEVAYVDSSGNMVLDGGVTSTTATFSGLLTSSAGHVATTLAVTDTTTLTSADCGQLITVSAGIDTKTITLPATIDGCTYTIVYIGADGGALVDISPNAADGIHGSCTLAASVLEFSGTDDADIGLTKATANTGDTITLAGDGGVGWYVTACAGIWANN